MCFGMTPSKTNISGFLKTDAAKKEAAQRSPHTSWTQTDGGANQWQGNWQKIQRSQETICTACPTHQSVDTLHGKMRVLNPFTLSWQTIVAQGNRLAEERMKTVEHKKENH